MIVMASETNLAEGTQIVTVPRATDIMHGRPGTATAPAALAVPLPTRTVTADRTLQMFSATHANELVMWLSIVICLPPLSVWNAT